MVCTRYFPVLSARGRVGFFSKTERMPGGAELLAQVEFRTNPEASGTIGLPISLPSRRKSAETCTHMFLPVLFITGRPGSRWKEPASHRRETVKEVHPVEY